MEAKIHDKHLMADHFKEANRLLSLAPPSRLCTKLITGGEMSELERWCEEIDAGVFSGDLLEDESRLNQLKEYVGRWLRAIKEQEGK